MHRSEYFVYLDGPRPAYSATRGPARAAAAKRPAPPRVPAVAALCCSEPAPAAGSVAALCDPPPAKRPALASMVLAPQLAPPACTDVHRQTLLRSMDLFMYVLYSGDELFVMHMVQQVTREACEKYSCDDFAPLLHRAEHPLLFKVLFFLMLNFYKKFRFWALSADLRLQPVCPFKATRFLITLKTELVPRFLVDERMRMEDLERQIKVAYIAS